MPASQQQFREVVFRGKDGEERVVRFRVGAKRKGDPSRPLTPMARFVRDNIKTLMVEEGLEAPEAMRRVARMYHRAKAQGSLNRRVLLSDFIRIGR
ncbi:hypothetical protein EBU60_07130 [bacterium]|jgi:hypothetical protein|nr:hypothetical protein [bacterium]